MHLWGNWILVSCDVLSVSFFFGLRLFRGHLVIAFPNWTSQSPPSLPSSPELTQMWADIKIDWDADIEKLLASIGHEISAQELAKKTAKKKPIKKKKPVARALNKLTNTHLLKHVSLADVCLLYTKPNRLSLGVVGSESTCASKADDESTSASPLSRASIYHKTTCPNNYRSYGHNCICTACGRICDSP